jgi:hypothetical protein
MATQNQIHANRSNAQLSTGPRTEPGKAISRRNALKTGIDARNEAASGEDPAVLAALAAEYDHEWEPIGLVERLLVDILVKDDWFLRRYRFLAADLVNHGAPVAYESKWGADFGAGFAANTDSFQRLHPHIVETERRCFTHLAELERRQALRRQYQPDVDSSVTDSPETENPGIGFVSQPIPPGTDKTDTNFWLTLPEIRSQSCLLGWAFGPRKLMKNCHADFIATHERPRD